MFNNIIKEHKAKQQQARAQLTDAKAAALSSMEHVSSEFLCELTGGVGLVLKNQKKIEVEAAQLAAQTDKFNKQVERWLILYNGLNDSLKELGDVVNWSQVIEADMTYIATSLSNVIAMKQQERQQQLQATQARIVSAATDTQQQNQPQLI